MRSEVVSDTIQEFNGTRYYLCGNYFKKQAKYLHRELWIAAHGDIPEGMHIHHIDRNTSNNSTANYAMLPASVHISLHQEGRANNNVGPMLKAAKEWHNSEAGADWHKEQYEKNCKGKMLTAVTKDCEHCHKTFTKTVAKPSLLRFCSNNCKSYFRRASGVDNVIRRCVECGDDFTTNKYGKTSRCSPRCSGTAAARARNAVI
jgi:hypothetical protein